jgi:hypothetical protein
MLLQSGQSLRRQHKIVVHASKNVQRAAIISLFMLTITALLLVALRVSVEAQTPFSFANTYGSNMVGSRVARAPH